MGRMSAKNQPTLEILLESPDFSCDRVQISRISGRECVSQLFRFEIFLASLEPAGLDTRAITGAQAALFFMVDGLEVRRVYGMIAEATDHLDSETQFSTYRLVFVPRAFRLTLVQTQEVYLDASVPDIIRQKMKLVGLDEDIDFSLSATYAAREFVVQYRETDLSFVSRLCEHLGVSFFFDHTGDRDRVVFTDDRAGFRTIEGADKVHYKARGERLGVYKVDMVSRVIPSMYVVSDYDYENPPLDLTASCEVKDGYGGGIIEYGTHHKAPEEGGRLAAVRAEERQAEALFVNGESSVPTLAAGARITLEDHPYLSPLDLLVVEVEHHLHQVALGSGGAGEPLRYSNTFRAIPASLTYRPPRATPRPRIHGVVSGFVEAAPGVDVAHAWIDKDGRYLVRILFDTAASGERKASLPIRMAQAHSGPGYGIHFPLRPGVEVVLAFIDGDPDRPVIMGAVPNALTPTPVFDADPTMHRMRTASGVQVEIDDGA
jgi:type VI secretion system secreted protein VgrG